MMENPYSSLLGVPLGLIGSWVIIRLIEGKLFNPLKCFLYPATLLRRWRLRRKVYSYFTGDRELVHYDSAYFVLTAEEGQRYYVGFLNDNDCITLIRDTYLNDKAIILDQPFRTSGAALRLLRDASRNTGGRWMPAFTEFSREAIKRMGEKV